MSELPKWDRCPWCSHPRRTGDIHPGCEVEFIDVLHGYGTDGWVRTRFPGRPEVEHLLRARHLMGTSPEVQEK